MTTLKGSAIGLAVLFLTGFGTIAVDSQSGVRRKTKRIAAIPCARHTCWARSG